MFGFGGSGLINNQALYYLSTNIGVFVLSIICSTPILDRFILIIKEKFKIIGVTVVPIVYLLIMMLSTAYLVNESYNPFLYFRF
jgi:alginate O-acetyltransferase complex protein AlgI